MKISNNNSRKKQSKKWELPNCANCSSNKFTIVLEDIPSWEHDDVFRVVKCTACGLIFVHPRPPMNKIGSYYPVESYWGRDIRDKETIANLIIQRERSFGVIYRTVLEHKQKGRILDIGAGTGIFLSKFKELGWHVDGVEFSKEAGDFSRSVFGVDLKVGDFLDHTYKANTFEVVTLNMSLEHLYEPTKTLHEVHKIMKKGGLLVITVPNIDSVGFAIFRGNWRALDPPRHLYHFTENTLKAVVTNAGFTVTGVNHWYWMHNYYTIFESFRSKLSPRQKFSVKEGGASRGNVPSDNRPKFSLKKEIAKTAIKLLSGIMAVGGSISKKSESIILVAVKQ